MDGALVAFGVSEGKQSWVEWIDARGGERTARVDVTSALVVELAERSVTMIREDSIEAWSEGVLKLRVSTEKRYASACRVGDALIAITVDLRTVSVWSAENGSVCHVAIPENFQSDAEPGIDRIGDASAVLALYENVGATPGGGFGAVPSMLRLSNLGACTCDGEIDFDPAATAESLREIVSPSRSRWRICVKADDVQVLVRSIEYHARALANVQGVSIRFGRDDTLEYDMTFDGQVIIDATLQRQSDSDLRARLDSIMERMNDKIVTVDDMCAPNGARLRFELGTVTTDPS